MEIEFVVWQTFSLVRLGQLNMYAQVSKQAGKEVCKQASIVYYLKAYSACKCTMVSTARSNNYNT